MKSAKHEVMGYLLRRSPIASLVGGRIFPGASPQVTEYPRVEVELEGREQSHHLAAAAAAVEAGFEINIYDESEDRVSVVARLVREAMNGEPGNFGELVVDHVRLDGETESVLAPNDGSDDPVYNVAQDWTVWYRENAPSFPAE